jgi:hypothetical protein
MQPLQTCGNLLSANDCVVAGWIALVGQWLQKFAKVSFLFPDGKFPQCADHRL